VVRSAQNGEPVFGKNTKAMGGLKMAYDMYLKVEGVEGDSTDAKHGKWIEIVSYNHGISQAPGGSLSGQGALTGGKADHQDFSITKRLDSSSPTLALKCCMGEAIPEITFELCRATGEKTTFMKYVMRNVIVASVSPSGSADSEDPLPSEEVTFRYGEIAWSYTPTSPTGETGAAVEASWSTMEDKAM